MFFVVDVFNDEAIENKVQNVLIKNKKAEKAAADARRIARIIKLVLCIPCTLVLFVFLYYSFVRTGRFILYTARSHRVSDMTLGIQNKAVASFVPNLMFSQALAIKSLGLPKWKFDIFLFAGRSEDFRIYKEVETSTKQQFILQPKSYHSTKYRINMGIKLESKFCFNKSNSREDIRIYKVYESSMENFKDYWLGNNRLATSFKFKRLPLSQNVSKCHFITINVTSLSSSQLNLVLANAGKTSVSAVIKSSLYKPILNKKGSFKTCLNTTYCMLPYRKVSYHAFIVRNVSFANLEKDIAVRCVARDTTIAIYTLIHIFCFAGYILLIKFCFLGVCFKYAKRFCGQCISNEDIRKKFLKI